MTNQILEKMIIDLKREIKSHKDSVEILESRIRNDIKNRDIIKKEKVEKQYVLALLENEEDII